MNAKKVYVYSGLALVGALGLYIYISKKKENQLKLAQVVTITEEDKIKTPTGDEIDIEQATIPKDLENVLKNNIPIAEKLLINKEMATKIANVKARSTNQVNNGIVNNIVGEISNPNINVGKVVGLIYDENNAKNPQGKVYKWFKIKPSQESFDEMNKNKSWFKPKLPKVTDTGNWLMYYREDTLTFKK